MRIDSIFNNIYFIDSAKAEALLPVVAGIFKGSPFFTGLDYTEERIKNRAVVNDVILEDDEEEHPEPTRTKKVMIIPMGGALTMDDQFCGPAGAKTIDSYLENAFNSTEVDAVVVSMDNCPGGDAAAMLRLANTIKNKNKPVVVHVKTLAASAHMGTAAYADKIFLSKPDDEIGSIGTYATIYDFKGFFEKEGISEIQEYATKSTEKNDWFRAALKGDTTKMKAMVDTYNEKFISIIKEGRPNISEDTLKGKLYFGDEAKGLGLFDGYATMQQAIQEAINLIPNYKNSEQMSKALISQETHPNILGAINTEQLESSKDGVFFNAEQLSSLEATLKANAEAAANFEAEKKAKETAEASLAEKETEVQTLTAERDELQQQVDEGPGAKTTKPTGKVADTTGEVVSEEDKAIAETRSALDRAREL